MAMRYSRCFLISQLKSTSTSLLNPGLWRSLVDLGISRMKPTWRGCRRGQRKGKCSTTQGTLTAGSNINDFLTSFGSQRQEIQSVVYLHSSSLNIQHDTSWSCNTNNTVSTQRILLDDISLSTNNNVINP